MMRNLTDGLYLKLGSRHQYWEGPDVNSGLTGPQRLTTCSIAEPEGIIIGDGKLPGLAQMRKDQVTHNMGTVCKATFSSTFFTRLKTDHLGGGVGVSRYYKKKHPSTCTIRLPSHTRKDLTEIEKGSAPLSAYDSNLDLFCKRRYCIHRIRWPNSTIRRDNNLPTWETCLSDPGVSIIAVRGGIPTRVVVHGVDIGSLLTRIFAVTKTTDTLKKGFELDLLPHYAVFSVKRLRPICRVSAWSCYTRSQWGLRRIGRSCSRES